MPIVKEKNRGYYKIKGAASAFNFDFREKIVLDIGSSTGGFTEYALDHGAKRVIAIEKGTNQMKFPLRNDPRIELHEKTDIFNVRFGAAADGILFEDNLRLSNPKVHIPDATENVARKATFPSSPTYDIKDEKVGPKKGMSGTPTPDVILADVSFVSLKKVLLHAKNHLAGNHTEFLVMLKPQFEARSDQLVNGIIKNEKIRREIIKDFEQWLKQNNFLIVKKRDSDLRGKTGNQERFYWLKIANMPQK